MLLALSKAFVDRMMESRHTTQRFQWGKKGEARTKNETYEPQIQDEHNRQLLLRQTRGIPRRQCRKPNVRTIVSFASPPQDAAHKPEAGATASCPAAFSGGEFFVGGIEWTKQKHGLTTEETGRQEDREKAQKRLYKDLHEE